MSDHTSRPARLAVDPLECRTTPATVNVTQAARPLDFQIQGTVWSEDRYTETTPSGTAAVVDSFSGTITGKGSLNYTDKTTGTSGSIQVSGTGQGETVRPAGGQTTDVATAVVKPANYDATYAGQLGLADDGGMLVTSSPFQGNQTWTAGTAKTTQPFGPHAVTGKLDVSTYTVTATWDGTTANGSSRGGFNGNVLQSGAATDLAFGDVTWEVSEAHEITIHANVEVTGRLMRAANEATAATRVTAVWEGADGKTEAAGVDVPVYWNTGHVDIDVQGLTAPDWATHLVFKADADGKISEANEGNNVWRLSMDEAVPPPPPLPPAPPPPPPTVASFTLTDGLDPRIQWRDSNNRVFGENMPFSTDYTGPVQLATGDVTGDGVLDAVVGAGEGGAPHVKVFDGRTGQEVASFFAYDEAFRGGVRIAVADVTGDGRADIVTGAGDGGGSHVKVFGGDGWQEVKSFFAYDSQYRNGVNLAVADLNGDGVAEIVTGTGAGGGSVVKVFDGRGGAEWLSLLAGSADDRNGVKVGVTRDSEGRPIITADLGDGRRPVLFRGPVLAGDAVLVRLVDAPDNAVVLG